jgi:hypothetical protein
MALMAIVPALTGLGGLAAVPALWLINVALGVGFVAAFRNSTRAGDLRLSISLGPLIVAMVFDWCALWVASTNAPAFAIALAVSAPLLALANGMGSVLRHRHAARSAVLLARSISPATALANGDEQRFLEDEGHGVGSP